MQKAERYVVLQVLVTIFNKERDCELISKQARGLHLEYDFFEDLYDIIDGFPYDEHRLGVRVYALLEQASKNLL